MKTILLTLAAALTLAPAGAQAGQLLFNLTDIDHPFVQVNTVNGQGGTCESLGDANFCQGFNFLAPAGAATVTVLDSFASSTTTFAVPDYDGRLIAEPVSKRADSSRVGGYFQFDWYGSPEGASIAEYFELYSSFFELDQLCSGQCVGQLTTGLQNAATITYFNAGGSVIRTDTIDVITENAATPEPSTALLFVPGFLVAGWFARVRSRR